MNFSIEHLSQTEYRKIQRYRLGLTQAQAAKKTGFSLAFYQLWETGKRHSERLEERFADLVSKQNRRNRLKAHAIES